jgi:hypothetical protein
MGDGLVGWRSCSSLNYIGGINFLGFSRDDAHDLYCIVDI